VFAVLVAASLLLAAVCRAVGNRVYTATASAAFAGHVTVGVATLRYLPYNWDIGTYHETAMALLAGQQPDGSSSTIAFGWVQAGLYTVFQPDVLVVAVFNSLLAVLIPLPVAALARSLYPALEDLNGVRTLVLFLPLSVLFLSIPMRDTLALALFVTALALGARALTGRPLLGLAAVPVVGTLALVRVELAGLVFAGTLLGIVVFAVQRYADRTVSVPSLVAGVGATGLIGVVPFARRYDLSTLNYQLRVRGVGGAAYLTPFQYGSWVDAFLAAPVRAIYFLYAPFPTHVDGVFDLVALFELPLLLVLTVAAVRSLRARNWSTPVGALLGLVLVGGVVGYGLIDANFGTTVRHRIPFVVVLVVFAAPVVERWWRSAAVTLRDTRSLQSEPTPDR
jgi:hypothetical protein